ncbi:HAD-IA family hydrolase [Exiguobacterium acetylicum]|uniref:HAD-IA family hydrolase n=1 Tax=Exiguobacterium acetylicum TaxID=41170 RepID=UPI001EE270B6|nr:HAD-IA family hydrolase [Exiguobacterium acetylicum]UKS57558.1 HAD-IA family hydrolase [Exiguobacterium acetylicum]
MLKHFIWDFDGTLFDTYPVLVDVFVELLEREGRLVDRVEVAELMAMSAKTTYEAFGVSDEFITTYKQQKTTIEFDRSHPFPGIQKLLETLSERGATHHIVTHRGQSIHALLTKHQLTHYFQDVLTAEQGFARKPDPEAVQYLIEQHQLQLSETIMIGDRELDVLAGHHAGIATCLISNQPSETVATYTVLSPDRLKELFLT